MNGKSWIMITAMLAALLMATLASDSMAADTVHYVIDGYVYASGQPVSNADVTISSASTVVHTNSNGYWRYDSATAPSGSVVFSTTGGSATGYIGNMLPASGYSSGSGYCYYFGFGVANVGGTAPTSEFTPHGNDPLNPYVAPYSAQFTFSGTAGADCTYWWDFGDGSNSTQQSPTHTFTSGGTYIVRCTVSNYYGSSSATHTFAVTSTATPTPTATLYKVTGRVYNCNGASLSGARVTLSNGPVEGNAGTALSGSDGTYVIYMSGTPSGTYVINVTKDGFTGRTGSCSLPGDMTLSGSTRILTMDAYIGPLVNFTCSPDQGAAPLTVRFTDRSTGCGSTWLWSFGDGTTSTQQSPVHIYTTQGLYVVTLKVSGTSADDTLSSYVYVNDNVAYKSFTITMIAGTTNLISVPYNTGFNASDFASRGIQMIMARARTGLIPMPTALPTVTPPTPTPTPGPTATPTPDVTVSVSSGTVRAVSDTGATISSGNSGTADATVIQDALDYLSKTSSVLRISPGTYTISSTILIDGFTGLTINAAGATIKLANDYTGYHDDLYYGVYVTNSQYFKLYGLTLDGNVAGQTTDNTMINFNHVDNSYIYGCTFTNAVSKAMAIRRGESTDLTIDTCHFIDNAKWPNMGCDVYCSPAADGVHSTSTYTFENCDFSRPSRTWGGGPAGQAFYVQSGTGYYYNNTFINMQKCYDFRNGVHTAVNAYGTDCGIAFITYDGQPTASMTNAIFTGLSGADYWYDQVGGIFLTGGTVTLDNVTITSSGGPASQDGIRIDGTYRPQGPVTVRNCHISGFVVDGIAISNTGGGHTISGNSIYNCGSYGIRSEGNTAQSTASGNVVTGVTTSYYYPDGMLSISAATPTPTATPTPVPGFTVVTSQDGSTHYKGPDGYIYDLYSSTYVRASDAYQWLGDHWPGSAGYYNVPGTPYGTATPTPTVTPTVTPTPGPTPTPVPPGGGGTWDWSSYGADHAGISGGPGPIYINPAVPSGASPVSSQAALDALSTGANAVLTADLSSLTVSRSINLFGNGHSVTAITITAASARVSGVRSAAITISANSVTVDHCNMKARGTAAAISANGVSSPRILSNMVNAYYTTSSTSCPGVSTDHSYGISVIDCSSPVIDGNTAWNAYNNIYVDTCTNIQVSYNRIPSPPGGQDTYNPVTGTGTGREGRGIDMQFYYNTGGRINNNQIDYFAYLGIGDTGAHYNAHDGMGIGDTTDSDTGCDYLTIDHNLIMGHYYPFKLYHSSYCNVAYNNITGGGFEFKTGFLSEYNTFQYNIAIGMPTVDDGRRVSPGLYVDRGARNTWFRYNDVSGCDYGIEVYSDYTDYTPIRECTNITFERCYMHSNARYYFDGGTTAASAPSTINFIPSRSDWSNYPIPPVGPTPTPVPTSGPTPTPNPTSGPTPTPTPTPSPTPSPGSDTTGVVRFKMYVANFSASAQDFAVGTYDAYIFTTAGSGTLTIYGSDDGLTTIPIRAGPNMIGWPTIKTTNASQLCSLIPGNQQVFMFDALERRYKVYVEGLEYNGIKINDYVMGPGNGYIIKSDVDTVFNFGAIT